MAGANEAIAGSTRGRRSRDLALIVGAASSLAVALVVAVTIASAAILPLDPENSAIILLSTYGSQIEAFITIATVFICVSMFANTYPRREGFSWCAPLCTCVGVAAYAGAAIYGNDNLLGSVGEYAYFFSQLLGFFGVVMLCCALVLACYDTSLWNALFCCTAGYTVQNLASGIHGFVMILCGYAGFTMRASTSGIISTNPIVTLVSLTGSSAVVITICYLTYVRRIKRSGFVDVENRSMLLALVAVLVFAIAFDLVNKGLSQPLASGEQNSFPPLFLITLKLTHGCTCVLVLFMQYELLHNKRLERDAIVAEQLSREELRQYQVSKETIEAINARCHDIRHQIRDLGERGLDVDAGTLAQIAREVSIYDTRVKTGNETLDVILTEKSLRCSRENITLSCICDGAALAFMSQIDLQALFGNALDNAIDAVCEISDSGKRSIGVVVRRRGDMVSVHVENYYTGEVRFVDGVPQSNKAGDLHGYGTHSMQLVVARHGGTISWRADGGVFHVNALLPVPES